MHNKILRTGIVTVICMAIVCLILTLTGCQTEQGREDSTFEKTEEIVSQYYNDYSIGMNDTDVTVKVWTPQEAENEQERVELLSTELCIEFGSEYNVYVYLLDAANHDTIEYSLCNGKEI